MRQFKIIVPGGLNTDIVGLGVDHLLSAGELTLGGKLHVDPGGISESKDEILDDKIYMLKPNEHEAEILTGIQIHDFESAGRAAGKLLDKGIEFVLITHGAQGGYLFGERLSKHIATPSQKKADFFDETGCGDQVTAILAACISENMDVIRSAELAIKAGTMQYYREGIQPVSRQELMIDID